MDAFLGELEGEDAHVLYGSYPPSGGLGGLSDAVLSHFAGDLEEAYRAIRRANPFPSVCARACDHPCESRCRAGTSGGDAIAVAGVVDSLRELAESGDQHGLRRVLAETLGSPELLGGDATEQRAP